MTRWINRKSASYIFSADVVRTLAIIGVVIIHTANSVFERPDFFGGISWWFSIVINAVSRICIPLFICLSGYFILRKEVRLKSIVSKTILRIVIPLVFWTALIFTTANLSTAYQIFDLSFILRFFNGNVYHFYFLVIIAGLYLVSPFLKSFLKQSSVKSQKYLAYALIGIGIIETGLEYLSNSCASENSFTKWLPFAGLFVIGYLIASEKIKYTNQKALLWSYLIGLLSTIGLDYWYYSMGSVNILRTNPTDCLTHYSDYYLSFNVVMMTIPVFYFLLKAKYGFINSFFRKIIYDISRASFGIYLIHLLIVTFWDKGIGWDADHPHLPLWLYLIVKLFGVFAISYILTVIVQKIPYVRVLIGEKWTKDEKED